MLPGLLLNLKRSDSFSLEKKGGRGRNSQSWAQNNLTSHVAMATTLNLANQHIELLKSDNMDLKLRKSKLERRVRDYESADNERKFTALRDAQDEALQGAKDAGQAAMADSQEKLQALEDKLNAANQKLNQKQMLKLGDDE
jgi:hypothetical protein